MGDGRDKGSKPKSPDISILTKLIAERPKGLATVGTAAAVGLEVASATGILPALTLVGRLAQRLHNTMDKGAANSSAEAPTKGPGKDATSPTGSATDKKETGTRTDTRFAPGPSENSSFKNDKKFQRETPEKTHQPKRRVAPTTEQSAIKPSSAPERVTQQPPIKPPSAPERATQQPPTEPSSAPEPAAQQPPIEPSSAPESVAQQPPIEPPSPEPAAQQPPIEPSSAPEPVAQQPPIEPSSAPEPVAQQPPIEPSSAPEPVAQQPPIEPPSAPEPLVKRLPREQAQKETRFTKQTDKGLRLSSTGNVTLGGSAALGTSAPSVQTELPSTPAIEQLGKPATLVAGNLTTGAGAASLNALAREPLSPAAKDLKLKVDGGIDVASTGSRTPGFNSVLGTSAPALESELPPAPSPKQPDKPPTLLTGNLTTGAGAASLNALPREPLSPAAKDLKLKVDGGIDVASTGSRTPGFNSVLGTSAPALESELPPAPSPKQPDKPATLLTGNLTTGAGAASLNAPARESLSPAAKDLKLKADGGTDLVSTGSRTSGFNSILGTSAPSVQNELPPAPSPKQPDKPATLLTGNLTPGGGASLNAPTSSVESPAAPKPVDAIVPGQTLTAYNQLRGTVQPSADTPAQPGTPPTGTNSNQPAALTDNSDNPQQPKISVAQSDSAVHGNAKDAAAVPATNGQLLRPTAGADALTQVNAATGKQPVTDAAGRLITPGTAPAAVSETVFAQAGKPTDNAAQSGTTTGRTFDEAFNALLASNGNRFSGDAAAPANAQVRSATDAASLISTPGAQLALSRESNSLNSTAALANNLVTSLIAGQVNGLYGNEATINGQGALAIKEAGAGNYLATKGGAELGSLTPGTMIIKDGQVPGIMGTVTGFQDISKGMSPPLAGGLPGEFTPGGKFNPGSVVVGATNGLVGTTQIGDGRAFGQVGQGLSILQTGQGAIKGIDDTSKTPSFVIGGDRIPGMPPGMSDTSIGGKKGITATEGISTISTVSMPLGPVTSKGDKTGLPVIEETKLPDPATPTTQPPMGLGAIAATTPATTTGTKDPNGQNTTTTTTGTGKKEEDWADTLPEIDIIDTTEREPVVLEPVKQAEPVVRKEVVVDTDDDDDDDDEDNDQFDQFVANDGKRGGGAYTPPQTRGFDNIRGLIEIIVADTAGQKIDSVKANQLFNELYGDNTKKQYIIKPGDTIEELALRLLKDKRLIPLLLSVNDLTNKDWRPGRNCKKGRHGQDYIEDLYTAELKPGLVLELPTRSQILRYKIHVLNDSSPLMVYANTLGDTKDGARGGKANEHLAYTCRLGDTLKSIAKRHPAIADENRWEEIARLNELPTQCYQNGQPVTVLARGQKLILPRPKAAIAELDFEDEAESTVSSFDSILTAAGYQPIAENHDGQTVVSFMDKLKSATVPVESAEISVTTRVVTQNDLGDGSNSLKLRLEMKIDDQWLPVIEYDINTPESGQQSGLKIYDLYGVRQVLPIRLPTRAARELAENDITINSQRYCELFINEYQLAA